MDKVMREERVPSISRAGLWMIGGTLLLSAAVLAWALQGAPTAGTSRVIHRPAPAARPTASPPRARTRTTVEELTARAPSADEYSPLLQGNVFQPRVMPHVDQISRPPAHTGNASTQRPQASSKGSVGPASTESWHDWKYNGIAEMDQQTYALMDLTGKKESRFVKVGDHLEDAIVQGVSENQVTLREAGGSVVHVQRVDAMAELMRSVHTAAPAARLAPPTTGTTPATGAPGSGPVIINPSGQGLPQAAPSAPVIQDDGSGGGRRGRRRRSQGFDGAGGFGDQ